MIFTFDFLVKHLPCDVSFFRDLLPFYLTSMEDKSCNRWIVQYACAILLVNLVQIPFPLVSIFPDVILKFVFQSFLKLTFI